MNKPYGNKPNSANGVFHKAILSNLINNSNSRQMRDMVNLQDGAKGWQKVNIIRSCFLAR